MSSGATMPLARRLDATLLAADATAADIRALVRSATALGCAAVCVNPVHVKTAARAAEGSALRVASVAGFPLGASPLSAKLEECRYAIGNGASELDVVIPIWAARAGETATVESELATILETARGAGGAAGSGGARAVCKFILEMALLGDRLAETVSVLNRLKPDFAKTGTGYARAVTVEDVVALRASLDPAVAIKAAGGIRTRAQAEALVAAGADRLGTSRAAELLAGQ
jgi:deoxyribose-phosphate aldolase